MRTAAWGLVLAVLLAACGDSQGANGDVAGSVSTPIELTDGEADWCAENPFEHGEAARALGIRVLGDYVRESAAAGGPDLTGWEPPLLAVPADGREPLTYKVQFDNRQDSNRACRAAFEAR